MLNSTSNNNEEIVMEPPLYFAEEHVWTVCFHPSADIIACSEITGQIEVLKYNSDDVVPIFQNKDMHKESARHCAFNQSGNLLATCGADKRIGFLDGNGKVAHVIRQAHPSPINRCNFLNDRIIASGDDNGVVKVWDLRTVAPVFQAQDQSEAITGIIHSEQHSEFIIYSSCLNGTVAAYDLRQTSDSMTKLLCLSDSIDEELSGLQIIKNGQYLVSSTSEGSIVIFKREELEHHVDRIQGQPGSVEAIIKIDENTIVTGSEDGFIRGVSIYPNKILPVLGQHEEEENFPISSLSLSHCKRFIASSSHDNSIKFYDVNDFVKNRKLAAQKNEQQQEQGVEMDAQISSQPWQESEQKGNPKSDSESDSDESESEEMEKPQKKKKKNKKLTIKAREKEIKKETTKSFFKGL